MLSGAFIVATAPARCAKSASVADAFSRIAWAKADHSGICASVMPSCDCKVRIRWSTAAWVAPDGVGVLDDCAAAGAAVGGVGAADCAKPTEGTSKAATETARKKFAVNIFALLGLAQRQWPWPPPKPPPCHPPCQPPPQPCGPGGRP